MARFARQHDYRIGRALAVAALLVIGGAWLFPIDLLRHFGRDLPNGDRSRLAAQQESVRLIPAEALPGWGSTNLVLRRIIPGADIDPLEDLPRTAKRHMWTFDPTTAWRPSSSNLSPIAPAIPDSVLRHAEFLHGMRLGNTSAALAMLDTTQAGRAHEQLAETDRWVNRYLAPLWNAQGRARRVADVWWRAVGEVEAEGSH